MTSPKLRFKEFDEDWNSIAIGNFLKIKSGLGFKAEEYTTKEEIRLLQIENVGYGAVKWTHNVKFVPCNYLDVHKELVLKEGDLVLALNRPVTNDQLKIAKLTKEDSPSILYQRVGKLDFLKKGIDRDFIFQIFQKDVKSYVLNSSIGSDQPFISTTDLYKHKLCIPSKEEQTKIASFLSAVDEKISQLTKKHELLSQYKQGMMQKLFSQQIRFKADDGSEFGGWDNLKIFDLAKDKTLNNGVFNDQNKVGKGYKLINVLDMYINRDIDESRLKLLDLSEKEFEKNKVYYGDIFFTRSSLVKEGIAFSNVYLGNSNDVTYDGHLIKLSPDLDRVNPIFLNYVLKTSAVRKQLIKGGKTATMTTIGQQEVGNTIVSLPCLEEQTKIANFLSAIDQKIEVVAQQIEQVKQWKKGLLQQMFV